jgi:hypothetical protein
MIMDSPFEVVMKIQVVVAALIVSMCAACGGGGSSDGTVFQGTVTEQGTGHSAMAVGLKHSAGQRIDDVKVCVLGECSITDSEGQWGVNVSNFMGGDVAIVLDGHGISATVSTNIPASAKEVYMDLDREGAEVTISKLLIDGDDHTGHSHDHND